MSADANTCAECLADLSGGGCHYRYGNDAECPLPKRADTPAQAIGRAILADLCGRRGIKNGIEGCDYVTPPTHWMPLPEVPGGDL